MTLGLLIYFLLGCRVLGALIPSYSFRLKLGESGHAGETALMAIACNIAVHGVMLFTISLDPLGVGLILASAVFFTYPVYYLVTTLWNLQPEVRGIISGKVRINAKHYANVPRKMRSKDEYLPITISLPVYTESNEVIFKTIKDCQRAISHYMHSTGQTANLLVSDDGLAKWLGGQVSKKSVEVCLEAVQRHAHVVRVSKEAEEFCAQTKISKQDFQKACERLDFYRSNNIAFVARPAAHRKGKFKKGGNLNYTNSLVKQLENGADLTALIAPGGLFEGAYAEGNIALHELICLLDKDSGLEPGVLAVTSPEFAADPHLAFTQHTTRAANENENYFSWIQARFTKTVYSVSLTSKASQRLCWEHVISSRHRCAQICCCTIFRISILRLPCPSS